jgi:tetratricopeptide (TPR) repeat protein
MFADGFTIEAAEQVCGAELDVLASLVDKSLLQRRGERLSMLATVHEYAVERLEASGEADDLGRAHIGWCLAQVRRVSEEAGGTVSPSSLAALTAERENLRTALRRASRLELHETVLELALELAEADFWRAPAQPAEGRAHLERALAALPDVDSALRARALYEAAVLAVLQGDGAGVVSLAEDALALARSDGEPLAAARSLAMLANLAVERGDEATAVRLSEEAVSIAQSAEDERTLLNALNSRAVVELAFGRYGPARELFERCLELARAVARRPHSVATATFNVAFACVLAGDEDDAERLLGESLGLSRELRDPDGIAYCLTAEAVLRARREEWPEAARLLAAVQDLLVEAGTALEPVERRFYEATLDEVRQRLGEEFAAAWAEGRALAEAELQQ